MHFAEIGECAMCIIGLSGMDAPVQNQDMFSLEIFVKFVIRYDIVW